MISTALSTIGKRRRISRLGDRSGRFRMLAIDQRLSLIRMIARARSIPEKDVPEHELRLIKRIVIETVSPLATAVLTDPIYGYDSSVDVIPPDIGVLLSLEVTGYEAGHAGERLTTLIDGWSVEKVLRSGADAAKLLLWHCPDASEYTHRHQQEVVRQVGQACARADIPFVLEIVTYAADGTKGGSVEYASRKPEYVEDAARVYTDPQYQVDLMKLEFPANLKFVSEFRGSGFAAGEAVYDLDHVREVCRRVDAASAVPWVILSAGVQADEFIENIRLACEAGASGFLCGRAVWKEVVDHSPDEADMRAFAETDGRTRFSRFAEVAAAARPWFDHSRFREDRRGPDPTEAGCWYRDYEGLTE
jgi:tagatose 1,6-diphosphate aldolase